jgi:hypothetical protein
MLLGCGKIDYELLPPKQHLVYSFVVIKHKYISLEMGESEFRWMAIVVRQISQLQPMNMGLHPFNL